MKKNTLTLKKLKGVTLIELTVVIAIILVLISVLFVGANYYRTSANRAACIVNLTNIHKAVRSVQNTENKSTTDTIGDAAIFGTGRPIEAKPTCPQGGTTNTYTLATNYTASGTIAVTCGNGHAPASTTGW